MGLPDREPNNYPDDYDADGDNDSPRSRWTTPDSRYHILCGPDGCGMVSTAKRLLAALTEAKREEPHHADCSGSVTIFDVMARHGAAQEWSVQGKALAYRA